MTTSAPARGRAPTLGRVELISHPFRVKADGAVATVTDGTLDAYAEAVAVLALTRVGERPLVPDFGVSDPTFADLDLAELNVKLDVFGPDVTVTGYDVEHPTPTTERITLTIDDGEED